MSAKQQHHQATYDAIVLLHAAGVSFGNIRKRTGVGVGTIYLALKKAGVTPKTEAEKPAFDKFRKLKEFPCQCGKGCMLVFTMPIGQRGRKYAKDCPFAEEIRKTKQAVNSKHYYATRRGALEASQHVVNGKPPSTHVKNETCKRCWNMSHVRPPEGCVKCKLPYAPEPALTQRERSWLNRAPGNFG